MNKTLPPSPFGGQETQYFYDLTPERILQAVEVFGFRCTGRCLPLNSMENRVYEVEIEVEDESVIKSRSEKFRIVKFYRPGRWSREQILDEHRFLLDLVEAEIPAVAPLTLANGETLSDIPGTKIMSAVFPKIGGRNPDEFNVEQLLQLGRLLARLHTVGAKREATHRVKLDENSYGRENLRYLLEARVIPPMFEKRYEATVTAICDFAAPLFKGAEAQRIHGDCHLGNILWTDTGAFLVDFDDMLQGPCIQDLWLTVPGRDEYARQDFEILIEGYEQMRTFSRKSLALIEPLRALRIIHFNAWIARRWGDPAFQRTFVNFGSDNYWQEQLNLLENQLSIMGAA